MPDTYADVDDLIADIGYKNDMPIAVGGAKLCRMVYRLLPLRLSVTRHDGSIQGRRCKRHERGVRPRRIGLRTMSSGFSTNGASDGTEQVDQAECGGVAAAILATVEQWAAGARVLSAPGDQREFIPALAIEVERVRQKSSCSGASGAGSGGRCGTLDQCGRICTGSRFLTDPNVLIDTSHLERVLRVVRMGRMSWRFCWTELGAKHIGIIQSLIGARRFHGIGSVHLPRRRSGAGQ